MSSKATQNKTGFYKGRNIDSYESAAFVFHDLDLPLDDDGHLIPIMSPGGLAVRARAKGWIDELGRLLKLPDKWRPCFGILRLRHSNLKYDNCESCPLNWSCGVVVTARVSFGLKEHYFLVDKEGKMAEGLPVLTAAEEINGWNDATTSLLENAAAKKAATSRERRRASSERYEEKRTIERTRVRAERLAVKEQQEAEYNEKVQVSLKLAEKDFDELSIGMALLKAHQKHVSDREFRTSLCSSKLRGLEKAWVAERAIKRAGGDKGCRTEAIVVQVYKQITGDSRNDTALRSAVYAKLKVLDRLRELGFEL